MHLIQDYIDSKTLEDGSDLAHYRDSLFYVLNSQADKRLKNLDEHLVAFPCVNVKLIEDALSPANFGSLFQSIMDADARRNLGAHYTSEENILKLIKLLFYMCCGQSLKIKINKKILSNFHKKLSTFIIF